MNYLWAQINRDEQTMFWAPTGWGRRTICLLHLLFYLPSNHSNHTVQWEDGFWFFGNRLRVVDA